MLRESARPPAFPPAVCPSVPQGKAGQLTRFPRPKHTQIIFAIFKVEEGEKHNV